MNTQTNISYEEYEEMHQRINLFDTAEYLDDVGVVSYLEDAVCFMNNPMQKHLLTQLLLIATKHELLLLQATPADKLLESHYG